LSLPFNIEGQVNCFLQKVNKRPSNWEVLVLPNCTWLFVFGHFKVLIYKQYIVPRIYYMRLLRLRLVTSIGLLLATVSVRGQNASFELWPEVDVWYRLNNSWRLSAFAPITKYNESKTRDLNIYLQADYAWGHSKHPYFNRLVDDNRNQQLKTWMVRGGYMKGVSIYDWGESYSEQMAFGELHSRWAYIKEVLFSQRLRVDNRWVGDQPVYSYRLRYRMMIEREFVSSKSSFVPYVSAEAYYDSRYSKINRIRLIGGTTISRGGPLALEGNITYQNDINYSTPNMFALNVILHVFLKRQPKQ
jgi:hypothetical protein